MSKINIAKVEIQRAEGRTDECTGWKSYASFAEANVELRTWARTAPKQRHGYHKCDFRVTYADGHVYEGRYDLTFDDCTKGEPIETHMREHITFSAGLRRPHHITEEQYRSYLSEIVGERLDAYKSFLETYAIGDGDAS